MCIRDRASNIPPAPNADPNSPTNLAKGAKVTINEVSINLEGNFDGDPEEFAEKLAEALPTALPKALANAVGF